MPYDYDRRRKVATELAAVLPYFERLVEILARHEPVALSNSDPRELRSLHPGINTVFQFARQHSVGKLFLAIVREYSMSPAERKVMERAALAFSRTRVGKPKPGTEAAFYLKTLEEYRLYIATAKRVLEKGDKHTDEGSTTIVQAGPFELVNTGGFSDAMMTDVAKVVEKATRQLKAKGLQRVCYGQIQVTNTLRKSTRVLAFYNSADDNLYLRANLKGKQGPALLSLTHELAHRLHHRFLKSKSGDIERLYESLSKQRRNMVIDLLRDKSHWPPVGEPAMIDGTSYTVRAVVPKGLGMAVQLVLPDNPRRGVVIDLVDYLDEKNPSASKAGAFVTRYARTDPGENFAEMVALYCDGQLPDDQVAMLEPIL